MEGRAPHPRLESPGLEEQAEDLLEDLLEDAYRARIPAPERSRVLARRVVALVEGTEGATELMRGLSAYAHLLLGPGDLEEEVAHGRKALDAFERHGSMAWEVRVLLDLSARAGRQGRLKEAEALLTRGLAAAREHGLADLEPGFLFNLGLLHVRTGDLPRGLELYQGARRAFRHLGRKAGEGAVLVQMGSAYRMLGAYPEALDSLVQGIELLEQEDERAHRVSGLGILSGVYTQVGITDQAIRHAEQACDLAAEGTPDAARAWYGLARAHREAGNEGPAREAAEHSMAVAQQIGRPFLRLDPLVELAEVELRAGRLDEAEARYREGMRILESMDVPDLELTLELGLAGVLEAQGRFEDAHALAQAAAGKVVQFGERHTLIELHELLGRLAEHRGDASAALDHVKRVLALRADVFSRETDIRVRNIQVAHELRHEREKSARVLRQLTRRVMESQEEERRRVASDLHDDLGQRLALLAVEIDLLGQSARDDEEEVRSAFERLGASAREIADRVQGISRHLHPSALAQLGLEEATRSVCEELDRVHDLEIEFAADGVPRRLPDDIALSLYRIAQEALNNTTKHAEATQASVRLRGTDTEIRLTVTDDGRGFDPDTLGTPGLGLAGMRERAGHLGGHLDLVSRPGHGTRIEVRLPLASEGEA